ELGRTELQGRPTGGKWSPTPGAGCWHCGFISRGNCITFTLLNEDHMLGNALQYMVMKNPDVEFCGYCITHPSESEINFQIQRYGMWALPAVEPFQKGLNDLMGVRVFLKSSGAFSREEEIQ
uniref:DNA-directed RNA polymerase RBP11-like dimerisation domain-containing protein n=1 Tax=Melopsittacus undulatus TaxID=13146 RepID=A0A8V5H5B8_MELUD